VTVWAKPSWIDVGGFCPAIPSMSTRQSAPAPAIQRSRARWQPRDTPISAAHQSAVPPRLARAKAMISSGDSTPRALTATTHGTGPSAASVAAGMLGAVVASGTPALSGKGAA